MQPHVKVYKHGVYSSYCSHPISVEGTLPLFFPQVCRENKADGALASVTEAERGQL